jgi:RND family efflux transporter MFP subunit
MKILSKIIIFLIAILAIGLLVNFFVFKRHSQKQETWQVRYEAVVQEISETGVVKRGEKIELGFENSGIIKDVFVQVGDKVEKGEILAKMDDSRLQVQLNQAEADLELAKAQLEKLLAPPTREEVNLAKIEVEKAQKTLENTRLNLEKTKDVANQKLEDNYQTALTYLEDGKLKVYDALNFLKDLQKSYFLSGDQISLSIKTKINAFEQIYSEISDYLEIVNKDSTFENLDFYLPKFQEEYSLAKSDLDFVKEKIQDPLYRNLVSSTDKATLDTHRLYISNVYNNLLSIISTISLKKSLNNQTITQAESEVSLAEIQVKKAKESLNKLLAPPREEDVKYSKARVKKAEEEVALLENQIEKTKIKSPVRGTIIDVKKSPGETIQGFVPFLVLLPDNPYYLEVDIYEEDFPKIKIGKKAKIELVAYPQKFLEGEIFFIEPSEKIINDVVYYPVKISIDNPGGIELKPGASADVSIIIEKKENALVIPEEALIKEENKEYVLMKEGEKAEKREVKTGLLGTNGLVEILEGLKEGDVIFVP